MERGHRSCYCDSPALYRKWVYPYVGTCYRKQICVDGKTICGASKRANTPLHMVSALVREDGVTLGQVKTEEKSNEITAIPALLSSLCIAGATVSIDAMGCQREIARTILAKEAHYMLAVKMNQPTLHDEIDEYFKWAMYDSIEKTKLDIYDEISGDHGRITKWKAVCIGILTFHLMRMPVGLAAQLPLKTFRSSVKWRCCYSKWIPQKKPASRVNAKLPVGIMTSLFASLILLIVNDFTLYRRKYIYTIFRRICYTIFYLIPFQNYWNESKENSIY